MRKIQSYKTKDDATPPGKTLLSEDPMPPEAAYRRYPSEVANQT